MVIPLVLNKPVDRGHEPGQGQMRIPFLTRRPGMGHYVCNPECVTSFNFIIQKFDRSGQAYRVDKI